MNSDKQKLGELLIKELDDSNDMITNWMVFYIAEQMQTVKKSSGKEKEEVEQKCFEAILKLWDHRTSWPNEKYPFKDFASIFTVLEQLNPEKDDFFYIRNQLPNHSEMKSINGILEIVKNIDKVARIWISFLLKEATKEILDEKTIEWINSSIPYLESCMPEVRIITRLIEDDICGDNEPKEKTIIEKRIEELERFQTFNKEIIEMYKRSIK
ncbi:hypothetical protein UT300005_03620 [Clostridium sp. CTA-5]